MAGCLLLVFLPCFQGEEVEQGETYWSFVSSITGWVLRSLLTALGMAQAVFSLSDKYLSISGTI